MKIRPVGAELFRADGRTDGHRQTDMTKPIADFRNFATLLRFSVCWLSDKRSQQQQHISVAFSDTVPTGRGIDTDSHKKRK
jgi:hypothetical protein